jgi:hypothetical protein
MLKVYEAENQQFIDRFISNTMSSKVWTGYAFLQPDCGKAVFPVQFVIVTEPKIKMATIQILN